MSKCVPQLFLGSLPRTRQSAIRYFHISHNASPPHTHTPKFCITYVFHFSWLLQPSQEKLKIMLMQFFFWGGGGGGGGGWGGGIRCIMGNVEVAYRPFIFLSLVTVPVPFSLLKWRKAQIAFRDTCISRQAEPHVSVRLKLKRGSRRTNYWSDRNSPITDYESS